MACCQNLLIHFEAQLINNFALLTKTATALTQSLADCGLSKRTTSPLCFLVWNRLRPAAFGHSKPRNTSVSTAGVGGSLLRKFTRSTCQ